MKCFAAFFFVALNLSTQTNDFAATNAAMAKVKTDQAASNIQLAEPIRAECVQGRRIICGKILKVLSGGLMVASGHTDLLRAPLNSSWLIPASATASRLADLIESREPGSVCVGMVFLTNLSRSHVNVDFEAAENPGAASGVK